MTDGWIGVIRAAFAAAILGVLVAAATSGQAPSTALLVALILLPIVIIVVARRARFRRARGVRNEFHYPVVRATPATSLGDAEASFASPPSGAPLTYATGPDWAGLGSICLALDMRHIDWLRHNDFSTPWLDNRVRPVIELEPRVAAAVEQSFEWELRSALQNLCGAVERFVTFYNERTSPDPLLLGEDWRFFERDEHAIEAETGVGEHLWSGRAVQLQELAVQVADSYVSFVSVAAEDERVRREVALPI